MAKSLACKGLVLALGSVRNVNLSGIGLLSSGAKISQLLRSVTALENAGVPSLAESTIQERPWISY